MRPSDGEPDRDKPAPSTSFPVIPTGQVRFSPVHSRLVVTTLDSVVARRWVRVEERAGALLARAASGREVEPSWLAASVAELAEGCPTWEELTGQVPLERSYRRLASSPHLEAWLICWPQDTHLQLHDHGGACGAFQVVDGSLEERRLVAAAGTGAPFAGGGATLRLRTLAAGEGASFDHDYIHDVRNVEPAPATSVHLYGAARRPMAFYRLDGGVARTVGPASALALSQGEDAAVAAGCSTRVQ